MKINKTVIFSKLRSIIYQISKNVTYNVEIYGFEHSLRKIAWYPDIFGFKVNVQHGGAWSKMMTLHLSNEITKYGNLPLISFQKEILQMWYNKTGQSGISIPHPFVYIHKKHVSLSKKKTISNSICFSFTHTYYVMKLRDYKRGILPENAWVDYKNLCIRYHSGCSDFIKKNYSAEKNIYISLSEHDYHEDIITIYKELGFNILPLLGVNDAYFIRKWIERMEIFDYVYLNSISLSGGYFLYKMGINHEYLKAEQINYRNYFFIDQAIKKKGIRNEEDLDILYKYYDINDLTFYDSYYDLSNWNLIIRLKLSLFLYGNLMKWIFRRYCLKQL